MEKLFSNQYLHVFLHRTPHQTIELQWLDFVPSADFRRGIEEVVRLAQQYQVKALIADNRLLRALRPTDLAWGGSLVFNDLSERGGRRLAVVESLDAMNRMGVTAMVAAVLPTTKLTSQFFASIEEARAWASAPL